MPFGLFNEHEINSKIHRVDNDQNMTSEIWKLDY